jgi:hypothetical protein
MAMAAISVLIGVLIIVVVGAICFWVIDRFAPDGQLAKLLKLLVVLDDRFRETGLDEASIHGTGIMLVDSSFGKI